jgi:uncharacterized protein
MRVTMVLTHDCNLACGYCYTGDKFAKTMPDKVGWEALRMAFRQVAPEEILTVSFFGGEPLLEFARMARFTRVASDWARRRHVPIEFQVTTNATILSEKILEFFAHYPFQVAFSVDGLGSDHDRHRSFVSGRPSSALVWRNLETAASSLPQATIHIVVNPDTVQGLPATVQRLGQLGYRDITLLPNMDTIWGSDSRTQVAQIYSQLVDLMQTSPLRVSPIYDMGLTEPRLQSCGFGADDVAVSPTGALYPCARLVGTDQREPIQLGHVKTGVDETKVKQIKARARAKQAGCGSEGGCACSTFMPGDVLRQMENTRFFDQLAASVMRGQHQGGALHV